MNRIDNKFKELKERNRKALITFITAGDPEPSATLRLVKVMEEAGADIIELGVPFSDPVAEGPVIQASSERALKHGTKLKDVFDSVTQVRKVSEVPIILLLYYNCIFKYGIERFFTEAKASGVDGVIVPDLPFEEREEADIYSEQNGIYIITLIAPTSNERMEKVLPKAKGFVYCVSSLGVTGVRNEFHKNLEQFVAEIRSYTDIPRAVGFGISNPEQAKMISGFSEGVIVGSAIVKKIGEVETVEEALERVRNFIRELRKAIE